MDLMRLPAERRDAERHRSNHSRASEMWRGIGISAGLVTTRIRTPTLSVGILLVLQMGGAAAFVEQPDQTPRIAVISAFNPEWLALKGAMTEMQTQTIADATYIVGKLQGKDVVLFLSGVSMVNAAMTTQGAIDHFKITRIIFSGIAGGTNPTLHAGDVVVADRWSEYLEAVFARKTPTGWFVPDWRRHELPPH